MEGEVRKEIEVCIQQAKNDPEIPLSELATDIYSQIPPNAMEVRGADAYTWLKAK